MNFKMIITVITFLICGSIQAKSLEPCASTFDVVTQFRFALAMIKLDPRQQALADEFIEMLDAEIAPEIICLEGLEGNDSEIKELTVKDARHSIVGTLKYDKFGTFEAIYFVEI